MKVRMKKFKNGERYPFMLDDDGIPDFWVTHFATQKLRMSRQANSMASYLEDLKHLKRWEDLNDRDLLEEIYQGKIPSQDDIDKIKIHCSLRVKSVDKLFKDKNKQPTNVVDMGKFYDARIENLATVSKSNYTTRVKRIKDFLYFIGLERVKLKASAVKLSDELDRMKKRFEVNDHPPLDSKTSTFDLTGITDEAFEDFVALAKPNSPYNPFTKNVRFRNYLIVQVAYETGIRCSEATALHISDIGTDATDPKLLIARRHDNPDDPRVNEPTAKTLGRGISISKELRDLLLLYVKEHRCITKKYKTHPFIFVTHKGKTGSYETGEPISNQSVNKLFDALKAVNEEHFKGITPHTFRHYFNDRLSALVDAKNEEVREEAERLETDGKVQEAKRYYDEHFISEQRELEIRAEVNGHESLDSGKLYLKRTTKKQATKLRNLMLSTLQNKVEGIFDAR